MTKPSINRKSRFKQGIYKPIHPEKYIGESEITYRSGWEKRMCFWLDTNDSVLLWNSESAIVPYISPIDNKIHKYYVDFLAKMRLKDGSEKTYAIEIKPKSQCLPSKARNKQRLITETATYLVNQAKWKFAKEHFEKQGVQFIVINEDDMGI